MLENIIKTSKIIKHIAPFVLLSSSLYACTMKARSPLGEYARDVISERRIECEDTGRPYEKNCAYPVPVLVVEF